MRATLRVLLIALLTSSCANLQSSHRDSAPAYTRSADNYVHFESSADLANYFRYHSGNGPMVSAHRGGPLKGYPENAIQTFDHALRFSPTIFECDLRISADGTWILMHDETLDRTTNGTGLVAETSFADLRKLLLRDNNGVITPFRIPTFEEALAWADGRGVLVLDPKPGVTPEKLVEFIRDHDAQNRVVVIIYTRELLRQYLELAPDLVYSVTFNSVDDVERYKSDGLNFDNVIAWLGVGSPDPAVIDAVHAENMMAMAGSFGEMDDRALAGGPDVYRSVFDLGLDIIATDNVMIASRLVSELHAFNDGR